LPDQAYAFWAGSDPDSQLFCISCGSARRMNSSVIPLFAEVMRRQVTTGINIENHHFFGCQIDNDPMEVML
jgi:hypothetical protein